MLLNVLLVCALISCVSSIYSDINPNYVFSINTVRDQTVFGVDSEVLIFPQVYDSTNPDTKIPFVFDMVFVPDREGDTTTVYENIQNHQGQIFTFCIEAQYTVSLYEHPYLPESEELLDLVIEIANYPIPIDNDTYVPLSVFTTEVISYSGIAGTTAAIGVHLYNIYQEEITTNLIGLELDLDSSHGMLIQVVLWSSTYNAYVASPTTGCCEETVISVMAGSSRVFLTSFTLHNTYGPLPNSILHAGEDSLTVVGSEFGLSLLPIDCRDQVIQADDIVVGSMLLQRTELFADTGVVSDDAVALLHWDEEQSKAVGTMILREEGSTLLFASNQFVDGTDSYVIGSTQVTAGISIVETIEGFNIALSSQSKLQGLETSVSANTSTAVFAALIPVNVAGNVVELDVSGRWVPSPGSASPASPNTPMDSIGQNFYTTTVQIPCGLGPSPRFEVCVGGVPANVNSSATIMVPFSDTVTLLSQEGLALIATVYDVCYNVVASPRGFSVEVGHRVLQLDDDWSTGSILVIGSQTARLLDPGGVVLASVVYSGLTTPVIILALTLTLAAVFVAGHLVIMKTCTTSQRYRPLTSTQEGEEDTTEARNNDSVAIPQRSASYLTFDVLGLEEPQNEELEELSISLVQMAPPATPHSATECSRAPPPQMRELEPTMMFTITTPHPDQDV
eukprot:gnl/Dysnectes_brevis/4611_a6272_438.p1 GENE.gnl/Dysnectes_brevis/4611_a6272_438~~gnl/Dysnectes_brevis/4611_a6272_438.p1  ORF type:complete len:677 (+),score=221.09 gnl/Dysnectes_brevis/4611_a6272_438:146-2176(+)